jgi:hypothetical protein
MNDLTQSRFGRALYEALPEVYRTRDGQGDDDGQGNLAAYLDSCGELLDVIYNSLDQRYKDCFPETCQEWLLPYFAELLGASTLSPHVEGRRKEIMHAIAWRQGKGSLKTIAQIAEEIGGFEKLVVQEGWKRVARTARINDPSVSPAVVDLRGKTQQDFIGHRNTAVCSVDVRKPDWRHGHVNPRAILLYVLPYQGFFTEKNIVYFEWKGSTVSGSGTYVDDWFDKVDDASGLPSDYIGLDYDDETWHFFKKPGVNKTIHIVCPPNLIGIKTLEPAGRYRFTELNLDDELKVTKGTSLVLERLAAHKITIQGSADTDTSPLIPTLIATDCLLKEINAPSSLARLVYCTVLNESIADRIEASDCIFTAMLYGNKDTKTPPSSERIRYSRHEQNIAGSAAYPVSFADGDGITFEWKYSTVNGAPDDVDSWFKKRSDTILASDFIGLEYDDKNKTWHFFKKLGKAEAVHIITVQKAGRKTLEAAKSPNPPFQYRFTEINLDDELKVTHGTFLVLEKLIVHKVTIEGAADKNKPPSIPTFTANDCLLQMISAPSSLVRLARCGVLCKSVVDRIEASDCIFKEMLYEDVKETRPPKSAIISYFQPGLATCCGNIIGNTTDMPVFYTKEWGKPGCGVLHPATPQSIGNGAEDGGEMGAFHHRAYVLAWEAVGRKLLDYLPVGMSAALIPDETLPEHA